MILSVVKFRCSSSNQAGKRYVVRHTKYFIYWYSRQNPAEIGRESGVGEGRGRKGGDNGTWDGKTTPRGKQPRGGEDPLRCGLDKDRS